MHALLLAEQLAKGARGWMRALPVTPARELSDDAVMTGITARLGLPTFATAAASCPLCGQAVGEDSDALARRHNLVCSHNSLIRTARHDVIRDIAAAALRACMGPDNVRTEVQLPGDGQQRSDVTWRDGDGRLHHLDVAVVTATLPPARGPRGDPDVDSPTRLDWPHPAAFALLSAVSSGMPTEVVAPQAELQQLQRAQSRQETVWPLHGGDTIEIQDAANQLSLEVGEAADALADQLDASDLPFQADTPQHHAWSEVTGELVLLASDSAKLDAMPELVEKYSSATITWLKKVWEKPVAAAQQLARRLEQVATQRVIAPKEREKRAKECVPFVLSARGARAPLSSKGGSSVTSTSPSQAADGGAGSAPDVFWSALRPGDKPAVDVSVSCALLQGAAMCDARMRGAHAP